MSGQIQNASQAPVVQCFKCHQDFILGVEGIETKNGTICDSCGYVVRDREGFAWTSQPNMCMCFECAGDNDECPVHGGDHETQ